MPMVEDFSVFLGVDEFATSALYDGTTTIDVLFDAEYSRPLQDSGRFSGRFGGVGVGSAQPMALCIDSDITGITAGKAFVINGTSYLSVGPPEPDGTGITLVMLQEV